MNTTEEHLSQIDLEARAWPCRCPDSVCLRCRGLESLVVLRASIAEMERKRATQAEQRRVQEQAYLDALAAYEKQVVGLESSCMKVEQKCYALTAERDQARTERKVWHHAVELKNGQIIKIMEANNEYEMALKESRERIRTLEEALRAVLVMWDRGPCPRKLDEALSWRENDERARAMADAALSPAIQRTPEEDKC